MDSILISNQLHIAMLSLYSYSGFHMHVIGPRATINISKCIITGRIVAVEQTPFSAALEEDWLAPVISSLTFAFSEL